MNKRKIQPWIVLTLAIPFCFALGHYFDSQCTPDRCIATALHEGFRSLDEDGDGKWESWNIRVSTDDEDGEDGLASLDDGKLKPAKLPPLEGITSVRVKSMVTNWVVQQDPNVEQPSLSYSGPADWKVESNGKELRIEGKERGPFEAHLILPPSFKGSIDLGSMSGNVRFEGKLAVKDLNVSVMSGDVEMRAWPSASLKIVSMSGNIEGAAASKVATKVIDLQTVSGDLAIQLSSPFERLSANTVSGDMRLRLPRTQAFTYKLASVSGEFEGLPQGGELRDDPGHRSYSGSYGAKPSASLDFLSVDGDFRLEQLDADAPNL